MNLARILFAVLAFAVTGVVCARIARPRPTTDELVARVTARGMKVTFDVPELHDLDGWPIQWERLPEIYADRWVPILERESAIYPEGFFERAKIGTLLLCRSVNTGGRFAGGLAVAERNAIVVGLNREYREPYVRRVIHHEIFHVVDARLRGDRPRDPEWEALNLATFEGYLGSGWHALGVAGYGGALTDEAGFLTQYAKASFREDRAELFSHAVTSAKVVEERAARDPVVRKKLAFVKRMAAAMGLGDDFWERARAVRRD